MADDELATTQEQELRKNLHIIQSMIDLSAQLLEGLRTKCATNSELTQQEIRTLEGKLIKLFSNQLITKLKLNSISSSKSSTNNGCSTTTGSSGTGQTNGEEEPIPSLAQWLQVVGLGPNSIQGLCQKISSVEELQEKSEHELRTILTERGARPEELSRLCRALHNLKRYTDVLKRADTNENGSATTNSSSSTSSSAPSANSAASAQDTMHLYWDSWDRHHHLNSSSSSSSNNTSAAAVAGGGTSSGGSGAGLSPRAGRTRATRTSVPSEDSLATSTSTGTTSFNNNVNNNNGMKFPTTPPPRRKHQTSSITANSGGMSSSSLIMGNNNNNNSSGIVHHHTPALLPDSYPLTKSKSHESQLANKSGGAVAPSNASSENNTCGDISSCGTESNLGTTATTTTTGSGMATVPRRTRFPTEPGPDLMTMSLMDYGTGITGTQTANSSPSSMLLNSPIKSPPYYYYNNAGTDSDDNSYKSATSLQVPKSPRTPVLPIGGGGGTATTISNNSTQNSQQQQIMVTMTTTSTTTTAPPVGVVRNMTHQIKHRFTKSFKMMSHCGYCQKPIYFGTGYKCKECKYTCHRECEDKVAPSCGLPPELLNEFKKKLSGEGQQVFPSPNMVRAASNNPTRNLVNSFSKHHRKKSNPQPSINIPLYQPPDSGSNTSSCNSSTPSSPAVQNIPTPHSSHKQQFNFPDVLPTEPTGEITIETHPLNVFHHHPHHHYDHHSASSTPHHHYQQQQQQYQYQASPQQQQQHQQVQSQSQQTIVTQSQANQTQNNHHHQNQTVAKQQQQQHQQEYQHQEIERTSSSVSGSTDSDKTPVRVDSLDSQVSDTETVSGGEGGRQWSIRQNSLSMREWDIPYEELKMNEPIGTGRFGTVYRGYWHGDVAVKVLDMHYLQDEKTLEQFKIEVSIFRKTRHENLILFMGACMQPPKLAIVTSLSKGMTLYTHIHLRKDKFNMNKTTIVAQQISQGMGYLHARGIVHKDLKSKNIFLENGKVVITDFGLFSVTKLCFGNKKNDSLGIPPGWLCYLSPEIIRSLHAHQSHDNELPFSQASDVYAFGTVWYELLCGEWPFKSQPPEAIIWQVGKGMKQPLANLQASRDVKDILMLCWSFNPDNRPDFIRLLRILNKLPKKRLARSPSHPIHLSRSAESVF